MNDIKKLKDHIPTYNPVRDSLDRVLSKLEIAKEEIEDLKKELNIYYQDGYNEGFKEATK